MYNFSVFEEKNNMITKWLSDEYMKIRTSKANPGLLDSIKVSVYGNNTSLRQVASISVEDPKTLLVTPYDPGVIQDIEKALNTSEIGFSVSVSGSSVRISFPPLTGERREMLIKSTKMKLEEAKVSLRGLRDEISKDIEKRVKGKEISEDEKFKIKETLQTKVDTQSLELEKIMKNKEKELLE